MKKKTKYYLIYTLVFAILALACFYTYYSRGLSLIYDGDGWSQHYKALIYYSDYLKGIFRSLFVDHHLTIPRFDFSIGEGRDIFENFNYYVIGDPIAFFSVLVPKAYIHLYYDLTVILRLYLSGIAFSMLAFYKKDRNEYGVLAGSIIYAFCFWMLFNAVRHIYFLNPMIYMPMVILGVEKIINDDNPYTLAFWVMISGLSNFYFFFDIVLLTVLYVAVRLLLLYGKDIKKMALMVLKIFKYSLIGALLSGAILLPVIGTYLGDSRTGLDYGKHLLYPLAYYLKLPSMFLSTSRQYWLCLGYASPVIMAIFALLMQFKKKPLLIIFLAFGALFILVPFFGQVLNGFSYMSNKWCFAFSLLVAYIMVEMWDDLGKHKKISLVLYILVFIACAILGPGLNMIVPLIIGLLFLGLLFIDKDKNHQLVQMGMIVLIAVNIIFLANWEYAEFGTNYSHTATTRDEVANIMEMSESYMFINEFNDDEFYRFSGSDLTQNASILFGTHTTDFYWSLNNPNEALFRRELALDEYSLFNYREFDCRNTLYTLANVKYYVTEKGYDGFLPEGFSYYRSIEDYDVYLNDNYLPFGYTVNKVMAYEDWQKLDAITKEEALSDYLVLEDCQSDSFISNIKDIEYSIAGDDIEVSPMGITVNKDGASATLTFKNDIGMSNYLLFAGFDFDDLKPWMADKETSAKIDVSGIERDKTFTYSTCDSRYYNARHEFALYLGENDEEQVNVTLTFNNKGFYSFESLSIKSIDNQMVAANLGKMGNDVLEDATFGVDEVSGKINSSKEQYLVLSIPYSKGWKAYVDNDEVELLKADVYHMAIKLDAGSHDIRLEYSNRMLTAGQFVSLFGIACLIADIVITKKKK